MRTRINNLLPIILLTLSAAGGNLSAAMTVEMDVQPRVIRVGEPAELRFTVRGADNPPAPPVTPVNGLQINGPSVGSSFNSSIVNGRITTDRATIFTYQILPLKADHYAIGPSEYRAGKESVALPAIAMKALSPRAVDSEGQVQNANQQSALFAR
ncbi:MAG: BatD family protein, partial [Kiritimatiellae bacterium]|nr:BatD family protein [Kiritimatiellia bacterium]